MHHMCVDMSTYCGDDWYNDMCGDVRMSIWISTYCEDVYMDIVWVGGGMVIACHVMPPHTEALMASSQQVLVPTSLPSRDLHFFSESHSLWEAPSWDCPELAWLFNCANVPAASCARADLLDPVPPRRAERGASCGFAWPTVRHTSRRGLDHKNWIFWIWPLSFHHQNYWMTKLSGFITLH